MTEIRNEFSFNPSDVELIVGTTPVISGTGSGILYDNNGILREEGSYRPTVQAMSQGSGNTCNSCTTVYGFNNTASGYYSSVFGYNNNSSNNYSTISGYSNSASGCQSTAIGLYNHANCDNSTAIGISNTASAYASSAMGKSNSTYGNYSSAVGFRNQVCGLQSYAFGSGNIASGGYSSVIGINNTDSGYANSSVFGYGNCGCNCQTVTVGGYNTVSGYASSAFGVCNTVPGYHSFAVGGYNTVSGYCSGAVGTCLNNSNDCNVMIGTGSGYVQVYSNGSLCGGSSTFYCTSPSNLDSPLGYPNIRLGVGPSLDSGRIVVEDNASHSWAIDSNVDGSGNPIFRWFTPGTVQMSLGYNYLCLNGSQSVNTAGAICGGSFTSAGHAGINATVTTSSLVGKTITFCHGIITSFS